MSKVTKLSRPPVSLMPISHNEALYRAKCILECLLAAGVGEHDDISEPAYAIEQAIDLIELALMEPDAAQKAAQGGAA